MKNKAIIILLVLVLIIMLGIMIVVYNKEKNKQEEVNNKEIEEIKDKTGATADTNIYQVEKEYDGREMLEIKPDIQIKSVWAGIKKGKLPTEDEVISLWKKKPTKTGIWISINSREKFLMILANNNINNFKIDENGYLYKAQLSQNNIAKRLEEMINSNKTYIIDISGTCYIRDEMSGELIEYPFEDMDQYQVCEPYYYDNNIIIEVTTNKAEKLSNDEILSAIVQY